MRLYYWFNHQNRKPDYKIIGKIKFDPGWYDGRTNYVYGTYSRLVEIDNEYYTMRIHVKCRINSRHYIAEPTKKNDLMIFFDKGF